jgi:hypothetical protein
MYLHFKNSKNFKAFSPEFYPIWFAQSSTSLYMINQKGGPKISTFFSSLMMEKETLNIKD